MSGLEGRCKPILEPLITGHPARLGPDAQAVLALWAVKTAWVFQSTNPATSTCTADQKRAIGVDGTVPDGVQVLLGGYQETGDNVVCTYWYTAGSTTVAQPDRLDASATTLVIGRAVLQVLQMRAAADGPSSPPPQQPPPATFVLHNLLPPTGQSLDWPSGPPLCQADLDEFTKPPGFSTRPWPSLPPLTAPPSPSRARPPNALRIPAAHDRRRVRRVDLD